jgi:hypothetical protein
MDGSEKTRKRNIEGGKRDLVQRIRITSRENVTEWRTKESEKRVEELRSRRKYQEALGIYLFV